MYGILWHLSIEYIVYSTKLYIWVVPTVHSPLSEPPNMYANILVP